METKIHPKRELARLRSAITSHPWAITPEWLEMICSIVEGHVTGEVNQKFLAGMDDDEDTGNPTENDGKPYRVVNGVAILELSGPIFPRANLMTRLSGATSLEDFAAAYQMAMLNDDDVKTVLMHVDSPGGSVIKLFETADLIYDLKSQSNKVVVAQAMQSCSAALLLSSMSDFFYCSVDAPVGSIGVITEIADDDRRLKNMGVDIHTIRSASLKAPGRDVTPDQMDSIKRIVMAYDQMFDSYLKRARPAMDIAKVSTGEVWIGRQAEAIGLVDGIKSFEQVLAELGNPGK